ncbi:ferritin-like protein [Massilia sp. PAMC28688]|uniref:ferritin-like domain-containing protein n=1 Tax=Massilia sp. PAMC28688 TaxID=2861283 RepID=UPI001C629A1E|nr:ferritin-like protein [Massilia sp. PAMC28688]QYF91731.1 ferritin-like protein [Massilia sp. PAMC28688]
MDEINQTDQHEVRVNDREQLIYLLTEAAEIEHGLMCTYLYAGWSLKRSTSENISEEQLSTIERWRKEIRKVAMEEMVHLAMVNNMLMSIGSPPHFRRQNFPVPPGYHPSSLVVRLAPLSRDTLAHFVYLERPEGTEMAQAPGFESELDYQRRSPRATLTPTAEDFDTVSHLYRGIESGFAALADRLGESALFAGDPEAQIGPELMNLPGLFPVTDLASAQQAVQVIVEQGEGGRGCASESHFERFQKMAEEYDAFLAADSGFIPYRPVVSDPVMLAPIDECGTVHVAARDASRVLDLANAVYGLMLRLLASGTGMASGVAALRRVEIDGAVELMHVINSLAVTLTGMPADAAGATRGGMNFHLPRSALALPQRHAGTALMAERAHELAMALELLAGEVPAVDGALAQTLRGIGARLLEARPH